MVLKRLVTMLSIGFILLTLVSCTEEDEKEGLAQRTLVVYLGGDNNLSSETTRKISSLARGYKSEYGNLIIYQDDASQPKLWQVKDDENGVGKPILLKQLEESNSADGTVFSGVLSEVVKQFPASTYGLIVFSHGSGWLPAGTYATPKTIVVDGVHEMEIADFAKAIPDHLFDYIVFEACYMANIEATYQLRNKAKYILGSAAEMLSPGFEDIYPSHLYKLLKKEPDLRGFAEAYFSYFDGMQGVNRSATVSVVCTDSLTRLASNARRCLVTARLDTLHTQHLQQFDRLQDSRGRHLFFDLDSFIKVASPTSAYAEFNKMLSHCVLYKRSTQYFMLGSGGGFVVRTHCGLTTYINQPDYTVINEKYKETDWWRDVLKN